MTNFHHLHVMIPDILFFQWKINQNLNERGVSNRIRLLIEMDSNLTRQQTDKIELENEKIALSKQKETIETQISVCNLKLKEIEEQEKIKDEQQVLDEVRLAKEMIARGL